MVARAWPHDGIRPLEVWDVLVDGRSLFARRDEPTFYASLAAAALALQRGEARRAAGSLLAAVAWESLVLVGGAVDEERARAAFADAEIAFELAEPDPCYVVRLAREAIEAADGDAVVIDVGQTAIKAAGAGGVVHRRHEAQLRERATLVRAIAEVIADACLQGRPSTILVALPCEVTATQGAIVLGASTLPTAGDGAAFAEALGSQLPWAGDIALVNDAVLAAWAIARRSPRAGAAGARLVFTLGFGVGGALLASTT